ncbi:MAG: nucleotidyltransferase domain-containing protein [Colwellia sp.]|nr:nucleotidyltransferase domain-containing protein [Colwellia sp.]
MPISTEIITNKIREYGLANNDIEAIWLYGSRAQGNENPDSDYDLAIAFKNFALTPANILLRTNELALIWAQKLMQASDKISIVDINQIPVYLAFNVIEYGKIIYALDTIRVIKEQNRIYSQFEFQIKEQQHNEK